MCGICQGSSLDTQYTIVHRNRALRHLWPFCVCIHSLSEEINRNALYGGAQMCCSVGDKEGKERERETGELSRSSLSAWSLTDQAAAKAPDTLCLFHLFYVFIDLVDFYCL